MKRLCFYLTMILILPSCSDNNTDKQLKDTVLLKTTIENEGQSEEETKQEIDNSGGAEAPDFCDTLHRYFKEFEIIPIIDNSYNDGNDTSSTFKIGSHTIKWKYDDTTTFVKIDDQKILFDQEDFDGPYSIGGIRLYSINNREILAIEFYVEGCGGNCFGGNSLFYDFQNKSTNYFSYMAMNCFSLYDFKRDNTIDLLSPSFSGEYQGPFYETYTLFKLNSKGKFKPETDKFGTPYSIKIFYPERAPDVECEKSETNWFEKIDIN